MENTIYFIFVFDEGLRARVLRDAGDMLAAEIRKLDEAIPSYPLKTEARDHMEGWRRATAYALETLKTSGKIDTKPLGLIAEYRIQRLFQEAQRDQRLNDLENEDEDNEEDE